MKDFTIQFTSSKTADELFQLFQEIPQWWIGLYEETITGSSKQLGDEFRFQAGGGMHNTNQKLIERIPNKKLTWEVTESQLNFLQDPTEWKGTKISFELEQLANSTQITFTHFGLIPSIECYDNCSSAWTLYMEQLRKKLA